MCLIIDVNVAKAVLCSDNPAYELVRQSIRDGKSCLYYGGQLRREYLLVKEVFAEVIRLDRAGRAKLLPDKEIDDLTQHLKAAAVCRSNDEHVIALATVAKARLLFTEDQQLQQDFTNAELLKPPRGNIYKNASHRQLLNKHKRSC